MNTQDEVDAMDVVIKKYVRSPDVVALRVRLLLDRTGRTTGALAQRLGIGKPGLSNALTRKGALKGHLVGIADFFGIPLDALVGPERAFRSALEGIQDRVELPPGCRIVRLGKDDGRRAGSHALLSPPGVVPREGDTVVFLEASGPVVGESLGRDAATDVWMFKIAGQNRGYPGDKLPDFGVLIGLLHVVRMPEPLKP